MESQLELTCIVQASAIAAGIELQFLPFDGDESCGGE
jgi:hypothetical protein